MNYDYNRKAFRSVCKATGIEPLAATYCSCVLLELSLKQHLNLTASASNGGHDLPALVHRVGQIHSRHAVVCNALQRQLGDSLGKLYSQSRMGVPRSVPMNSYPYIRYLRHDSDWPSDCTSEGDLVALHALLQRVISVLAYTIGVSV